MKKVSIIVPVYNVQEYLNKCLETIVKQTLKDIEIIIVNDGSTDKSSEIIEKYNTLHNNIIVINQKNSGLSAARNSGLKIASGKYLMFIDSDDFIDLDMLEKMYNKAENNNCPLVICDLLLYWNKNKTKKYNNLREDENKIYTSNELYKILLSRRLNCQVMNKLYRRDIWEKHNIIFENGRYYEDIIPSFKIVSAYKEAMFINESLYKYRMREGSITASSTRQKLSDLIRSIKIAREDAIINNNIEKSELDKYIMSFNINYGLYALQLNARLQKNENMISNIKKNIQLNYKIYEVLLNRKIIIKTKIKFILMKIRFKE